MTGTLHPGFVEYLIELIELSFDSPGELARAAEMSESILSKWGKGDRGLSHETLRKIAPFLGVTYGDLMVAAGLATPEEFPSRGSAPKPRRYAKTLTTIQDHLEDKEWTKREKERLLVWLRWVNKDAEDLHEDLHDGRMGRR